MPDGVSLRARVAGTAVFVRPASATGDWVAIIAGGAGDGTIAGVRILSTAEAPVQVGIRLRGQGHALELLQVDGTTRAGVELLPDATATLLGSHFAVPGAAVTLAPGSRLEATGNVFVHDGPATRGTVAAPPASPAPARGRPARSSPTPIPPAVPAIAATGDAEVVVRRNVFVGFGPAPVQGPSTSVLTEPVPAANVVVSAVPSPTHRPAGDR